MKNQLKESGLEIELKNNDFIFIQNK